MQRSRGAASSLTFANGCSMQTERRVYLACLALSILIAGSAAVHAVRWWRSGSDWPIPAALGLGALGNAAVAYMAWHALHGHRPTGRGRLALLMKLLSASIFLTLFGPRLLASLTR